VHEILIWMKTYPEFFGITFVLIVTLIIGVWNSYHAKRGPNDIGGTGSSGYDPTTSSSSNNSSYDCGGSDSGGTDCGGDGN